MKFMNNLLKSLLFIPILLSFNCFSIEKHEKTSVITINKPFSIKFDEKITKVYKSVYFIETLDGVCGTAFIIGSDNNHIYLLTDYHVVSNCIKNKSILLGGPPRIISGLSEFTANFNLLQVIDYSDELDIALISMEKPKNFSYTSLKLFDNEMPSVGTDIHIAGYPLVMGLTFTKGTIVRYHTDPLNHLEIQTDAFAFCGTSGGPILDDDLNVIGILKYIHTSEKNGYGLSNFNGGLSSYEVIKWIKSGKYKFVLDGK